MDKMRFEWDEAKASANRKKHNISFAEATSVFYDDNAILFDDPDHSEDEERFILLGISVNTNLLVVCHCYRQSETIIRLISARKATKKEASQYIELNKDKE